jgi:hypothetical protein
MIVRDEGLLRFLRDELPGRVSQALRGDSASALRGLAGLCVEALARGCSAFGVDCGGDPRVVAWRVLERVIGFSREFVLARYMAIAASADFIASVGDSLIVDMLVRDLITCIEKVRVLMLRMVEEGRPWVEIYSVGD